MRYWDIFKEIDALRRELDQTHRTWRHPFSRVSFLPAMGARQYPMVNIYDDSDNVYVDALAPGVNPELLEITVTQKELKISGEKVAASAEVKSEEYHRSERATGKFIRSFDLTTPVNEKKVKAEYKDGLLKVILPKADAAKPRKIAITAG